MQLPNINLVTISANLNKIWYEFEINRILITINTNVVINIFSI